MRMVKQRVPLKDNHTWRAPKGYKILVADRGAVSFNIPATWHLEKFEPLELYDKAPPDDNVRLSMSFWRMPPGVDWSGLPLQKLLEEVTKNPEGDVLARGEVQTVDRSDIEIAWIEQRFMDTKEQREAFSRNAIARGFDIHTLLTLDFWVDDAPKVEPIWREVLRSLQLGRKIDDPTRGVAHQ